MKLKICGMKYKDNIEAVAKLQPNYLGFIFYKKSSRYFNGEIPKLPNNIKKVGVFVNEDLDIVTKKIKTHKLNAIQLHGNESPNYCFQLKSKCHTESSQNTIELIKVFSIKEHFNFSALTPYENVCDYYLFDTKGKLPGGNGYTFNWQVLKDYPSTKPYFLSGGIGLDEIDKISSFLRRQESQHCYAIDVNSKFEIEPGLKNIKDLEKLKNDI